MDGKRCAGSVLGLANQIKRVFDTTTGRCDTQTRILNFVLVSYPDREIYQKDIKGYRRGTEYKKRIRFHAFEKNGGPGLYPQGKGFLR